MLKCYENGLVEMVSPQVKFDDGLPKRSLSMRNLLRKREFPNSIDSRVMLANNKLIELAVKQCSKKLFITYSTELPTDFLRVNVPEIYNALWDMCIHLGKMNLECVILHPGISGMSSKYDILPKVQAVMNVGAEIDKNVLRLKDLESFDIELVSFEPEIKSIINGSPFVLYDNPHDKLPSVDNVALGGTFDNLHNGHRNLISAALVICKKALYVGITSPSLLGEKSKASLIESLDTRMNRAKSFLSTMVRNDAIDVHIVVLKDPFGPTILDEAINAVVVSSETLGGARKINEIRKEKGFTPVDIVTVLRSNIHTLSSTFIRDNKDLEAPSQDDEPS